MGNLSKRERLLLMLCFVTIFVVINGFIGKAVYKKLNGSGRELEDLRIEKMQIEQLMAGAELWEKRKEWLDEHLPPPMVSVGRAQGELAEQLQQSLFEQKITIERQTLLEPVMTPFYDEVAVTLRIEGEAVKVNEWLTTLQSPEAFQTIKNIELELDNRSREKEPQAECEVTIARWFSPRASAAPTPPVAPDTPSVEPEAPATPATPATEAVPETEPKPAPVPATTQAPNSSSEKTGS
jgi:hypothetical protein